MHKTCTNDSEKIYIYIYHHILLWSFWETEIKTNKASEAKC